MGIRNPFLFRATEQNSEDDLFVQLFSEDILNILNDNISNIFIKPLILRSSPGFGKTSLLKLFTAQILNRLINYHSSNDNRDELYKAVKNLGFINSSNHISKVGIYIPCTNLYTNLQDVISEDKNKNSLFFALLNAKILFEFVQTVKQVCIEKHTSFNDDLLKIYIEDKSEIPLFLKEDYKKDYYTLQDFYNFAISVEKEILNYIDNFGLIDYDPSIQISNLELHSFNILSKSMIKYDGIRLDTSFVIMFDDLHKLAIEQRNLIYKTILNDRYNIPIWIAERLSILTDNSIFNGTTHHRDYISIHLEESIRHGKKKLFENFLSKITSHRMSFSNNNIASFETKLLNSLKEDNIGICIKKIKHDLQKNYSNSSKYTQLIKDLDEYTDTDYTTLLKVIVYSIIIERDKQNNQPTFDFAEIQSNVPKDNYAKLKPTAEYFAMLFYKIPYYYTFERLTKLASFNTEQFLGLASSLYEEMIARSVINKQDPLSGKLQEKIIKKYAEDKWNEIETNIPRGTVIQSLLKSQLDFSLEQSKRPSAPYAPGVTGFAITNTDLKNLQEKPQYKTLKKIIMSCIAYNLLTVDENKKQGNKDSEPVTIFYFNRWLCVKFKLPIPYGGWRKKKLAELNKVVTLHQEITEQFDIFKEDS